MSEALLVTRADVRALLPGGCVRYMHDGERVLRASRSDRTGCIIAGVGVDAPQKRELAPRLLATASRVVTDLRARCAAIGDFHHALAAGAMTEADVHADLGDVVAGIRCGRERADEVIVFDSTGIALQDVAVAAAIYERVAHGGATTLRRIAFA